MRSGDSSWLDIGSEYRGGRLVVYNLTVGVVAIKNLLDFVLRLHTGRSSRY